MHVYCLNFLTAECPEDDDKILSCLWAGKMTLNTHIHYFSHGNLPQHDRHFAIATSQNGEEFEADAYKLPLLVPHTLK